MESTSLSSFTQYLEDSFSFHLTFSFGDEKRRKRKEAGWLFAVLCTFSLCIGKRGGNVFSYPPLFSCRFPPRLAEEEEGGESSFLPPSHFTSSPASLLLHPSDERKRGEGERGGEEGMEEDSLAFILPSSSTFPTFPISRWREVKERGRGGRGRKSKSKPFSSILLLLPPFSTTLYTSYTTFPSRLGR